MKENNKRRMIMLLLFIVMTIVVISVATFAYFSSSVNANANVPLNVATANGSVFTASSEGGIELDLGFEQMSQANVSTNIVASDNATVTVRLDSESENDAMLCTYDLVWVWDSGDKYTDADTPLPHTEGNITYNYELSSKIDSDAEKDLSSFTWNQVDSKYEAVIGSEEIKVNGKGSKTNTHEIVVSAYNIPVNQANLFNKTFKAHIEVKNNVCKAINPDDLAYHEKCNDGSAACTIAKLYTADGANGFYYHDGKGNYTNSNLEAGDNSYRYSGADPDNYVCFTEGCSDDNKYRIIGVFDNKVKVIKHIKLNSNMKWNENAVNAEGNTNIWEESSLETYLNDEETGYLSTIKAYKNMIADNNWITSGLSDYVIRNNANNAKRTYDYEIAETCSYCGSIKSEITVLQRKIGLMYVSDYMYAAEDIYWNKKGTEYGSDEVKAVNWLYDSANWQWTISRDSLSNNRTFNIQKAGDVYYYPVNDSDAVRPSFVLSSSVKIIDGSGKSNDPYIIGL